MIEVPDSMADPELGGDAGGGGGSSFGLLASQRAGGIAGVVAGGTIGLALLGCAGAGSELERIRGSNKTTAPTIKHNDAARARIMRFRATDR